MPVSSEGFSDSVGHMLGHCKHNELRARHDNCKAKRKVSRKVMKGCSRGHFIIANVGQLEGLSRLRTRGP